MRTWPTMQANHRIKKNSAWFRFVQIIFIFWFEYFMKAGLKLRKIFPYSFSHPFVRNDIYYLRGIGFLFAVSGIVSRHQSEFGFDFGFRRKSLLIHCHFRSSVSTCPSRWYAFRSSSLLVCQWVLKQLAFFQTETARTGTAGDNDCKRGSVRIC